MLAYFFGVIFSSFIVSLVIPIYAKGLSNSFWRLLSMAVVVSGVFGLPAALVSLIFYLLQKEINNARFWVGWFGIIITYTFVLCALFYFVFGPSKGILSLYSIFYGSMIGFMLQYFHKKEFFRKPTIHVQ